MNTNACLIFTLTTIASVIIILIASRIAYHAGHHVGYDAGARDEAIRYNDELLKRGAAIAIWDNAASRMQIHFPEGATAEFCHQFAAHFRYQELGEAEYAATMPENIQEILDRWNSTSDLGKFTGKHDLHQLIDTSA